MLVTRGRMLRGRYAAVTDVSSGASPRGADEHGAPLQVARARTRDRAAVRLGVRPAPVAPGFVGRPRVAGARGDLDARAGGRLRLPVDRAPRRDRLRVAHVGRVGAAVGARRPTAAAPCPGLDVANSIRPLRSGRSVVTCCDVGARDQRRLHRIAGRADRSCPRCRWRRARCRSASNARSYGDVFARLPDQVPCAVRHDAVDGAGARPLVPRGGACGAAPPRPRTASATMVMAVTSVDTDAIGCCAGGGLGAGAATILRGEPRPLTAAA